MLVETTRPASALEVPTTRRLPRGWQAYAIFLSLPVMWFLGLSFFQWPLIVFPLVIPLARAGNLRVPRRFGMWLLFMAWVVLSAVELHSGSRAIAWAWRGSFYITATILFLYIYNSPESRLPKRAVVNAIAGYWVAIVAGGWFGVLFPNVQIISPAEHIFPKSLLHNTYFYSHTHLQFAQVQHFLGFREGRPQTFFPYTNAWGSTFAMLAPIAIAAFIGTKNRTWRRVLMVTMAAAVVPVIFSLDRGEWLSLLVALVYAAARLGARRDFRVVAGVAMSFVTVAMLILLTPLGGLVTGRFTHKTGDASRIARDQTAQAQSASSPWFGYGAPQQQTAITHTQKSVGTESEIFLILYSHGYPALFLIVFWFAYVVFRSGRRRDRAPPYIFWVHVALLAACIQTPYYELTERIPLMMAMAAIVLKQISEQNGGLLVHRRMLWRRAPLVAPAAPPTA
ncbi:MAG TPA: O-antigen ligase family protein [Gaiellales bacterium]|nr:O-antigen ligase family protein [Gaiellales bacterium]